MQQHACDDANGKCQYIARYKLYWQDQEEYYCGVHLATGVRLILDTQEYPEQDKVVVSYLGEPTYAGSELHSRDAQAYARKLETSSTYGSESARHHSAS